MHRNEISWSHRVNDRNGQPQKWAPHPHKDKGHDAIDNGPEEHEGNPQDDDEDVIDDKLRVFKNDPQDLVERREGLGLVVLLKAIFKLQLQGEGMKLYNSLLT